jgi:site-specific DNA recombinase
MARTPKNPAPSSSQRLATEARTQIKKVRKGPARRRGTNAVKVVAIYLRISKDAEARGLGVARQRQDARAVAAAKCPGAEIIEFVDNDISGGDFTDRAAYDEMLGHVEGGKFSTVISYDLDRLTREGLESEELFLIAELYRMRIITTTDDLEPGTDGDEGEMAMARVRAAFAVMERAKIRRRTRRKHNELAMAGSLSGGGSRPFGYTPDRLHVVEREAELIREAVRRVLGGEGVSGVTKDWNNRGITTADRYERLRDEHGEYVLDESGDPTVAYVAGGFWRSNSLRRVLMSGRICGWRDHHGEMVAEAKWPAIVDKETVELLRRRLTDPARTTATSRKRKHLLTGGLLTCGRVLDDGEVCGHVLYSKPQNGKSGYGCLSEQGGCGRVRIVASYVDEAVVTTFFDILDALALGEIKSRSKQATQAAEVMKLRDQREAHERKLDELADLLGDGLMTKARYVKKHGEVQAKLDAVNRKLDGMADLDGIASMVADRERIRREWGDQTVDAQRAMIATIIESIPIGPGRVGANSFEDSRIGEPVFRF